MKTRRPHVRLSLATSRCHGGATDSVQPFLEDNRPAAVCISARAAFARHGRRDLTSLDRCTPERIPMPAAGYRLNLSVGVARAYPNTCRARIGVWNMTRFALRFEGAWHRAK